MEKAGRVWKPHGAKLNFKIWGGPGQQFFTQFFLCEYHRGNRLCTSPTTGFPPSPLYICKRRLIKRLKKGSLLVNLLETKPSTCDASKLPRATSLPQKSQLRAADWKIKSPVHKNFAPIVMQWMWRLHPAALLDQMTPKYTNEELVTYSSAPLERSS